MGSLKDVEFILAVMPFVDVLQPPLGPSVLCGALRANGIRMKVVYPAMTLAERLPYDLYRWFGGGVASRFGDYFFSNQVFGIDENRSKRFHSKVRSIAEKGRFPKFNSISDAECFIGLAPSIQAICDEVTREWVEKIIVNPKIKAVACSTTYVQLLPSLAFLKAVKDTRPDIKTIIGGCECEGEAALEIVSKLEFVDYAVSGEGEKTLPILVKGCLSDPLHGAGLPYGVFDKEKAREGVPESPKVDGCDFGEIDNSDYAEAAAASTLFKGSADVMSMEFSRGCWKGERSNCTFCGINGDRMNFRRKPKDRILQELKRAYDRGARFFFITDTALDLNYLRPVFEEFSAYADDVAFLADAVSTMGESQLKFLADSGVLFIQVGIESLHPKHVSLMNKGNSAVGSLAYLKFAKENMICAIWNLLVCIPGDSPKEYEELIELIPLLEHFTAPGFSHIRYDRFSEYWKNPERYGLALKPLDCNDYLFPDGYGVDTSKVSMYFEDTVKRATVSLDHPAIVQLEKMIEEWRLSSATLRFLPDGTIEDTRKCALERNYLPSSDEGIVLALTRNPMPFEQVHEKAKSEGCLDCETALRNLLERRFIVFWDGCFVSLVLVPISAGREKKILCRLKNAMELRKYTDTRLETQLSLQKSV